MNERNAQNQEAATLNPGLIPAREKTQPKDKEEDQEEDKYKNPEEI